jgi:hypothetical protein
MMLPAVSELAGFLEQPLPVQIQFNSLVINDPEKSVPISKCLHLNTFTNPEKSDARVEKLKNVCSKLGMSIVKINSLSCFLFA